LVSQVTAVRAAQRVVSHTMRTRPQDVRARMPFDPDDPDDFETWARRELARHHWDGAETEAYIIRRIVWAAMKAARRRSLHASPSQTNRIPLVGYRHRSEPGDPAADPAVSLDFSIENELVEELLACTMAAVASMIASSRCPRRKARALLGCLARIGYDIKSELSIRSTQYFLDQLLVHPVFGQLLLACGWKQQFEGAIRSVQITGNRRRDLATAGWPCAGNDQWILFATALKHQWSTRSGLHQRKGD
jgi:hypothetical protein